MNGFERTDRVPLVNRPAASLSRDSWIWDPVKKSWMIKREPCLGQMKQKDKLNVSNLSLRNPKVL